jgi:hypothetical protein
LLACNGLQTLETLKVKLAQVTLWPNYCVGGGGGGANKVAMDTQENLAKFGYKLNDESNFLM